MYIVDCSLRPKNGDTLFYEMNGNRSFGKLMGASIITTDGEAIEGESLADIVVIGKVTVTIIPSREDGGPTI